MIQDVTCFFSTEGIRAGQQWLSVINAELKLTSFGILCVTADNQHASWLNFEAGALAKGVVETHVVPVAIDFPIDNLEFPLRQFNGVGTTKEDIFGLMKSVYVVSQDREPDAAFEKTFDMWWPDLEAKLTEIAESSGKVEPIAPPSVEDLVTEVLGVVRGISRVVNGNEKRRRHADDTAPRDLVPGVGLYGTTAYRDLLRRVAEQDGSSEETIKHELNQISREAYLRSIRRDEAEDIVRLEELEAMESEAANFAGHEHDHDDDHYDEDQVRV